MTLSMLTLALSTVMMMINYKQLQQLSNQVGIQLILNVFLATAFYREDESNFERFPFHCFPQRNQKFHPFKTYI
jgi:hypothetical protein